MPLERTTATNERSENRRAFSPEDALAGTRSLAAIRATGDKETRLLRSVSLLEVIVRVFVLDPERASSSLNRMIEALVYAGKHPTSVSFRALEYALNVRNTLVHPGGGLRLTAPASPAEIDFACAILDAALDELTATLPPEIATRVRGDAPGS